MAILDDFEKIVPLALSERLQAEVVEDEQLGLGKRDETFAIGAVAACDA